MIAKAVAFLKRDFLKHSSYRFDILLKSLGIFIHIVLFYYIAKIFGKRPIPQLGEYGGHYFNFVLIGLALNSYIIVSLRAFAADIREEQLIGTLESLFFSATHNSTLIFFMSLWSWVSTSTYLFLYLIIGVFFFNVHISLVNMPTALVVLLLTVMPTSAIGIMVASFTILFKKHFAIIFVIEAIFRIFSGCYFPPTIFPECLRMVSYMLPVTYSLRALRLSLLQGYCLSDLIPEVTALICFSLILVPISLILYHLSIRRVRICGSLGYY